jgi:hypothetical protein
LTGSGQAAYELFRLEELEDENGFMRFVALLGRNAILGGPPAGPSPLAEILLASERTEREITTKLYAEYRGIRSRLFEEFRRHHSNIPSNDLLAYAQTILDRVLFLAFAEDRQLLPAGTIARAYQHRDPYNPRPNLAELRRRVQGGRQGQRPTRDSSLQRRPVSRSRGFRGIGDLRRTVRGFQ